MIEPWVIPALERIADALDDASMKLAEQGDYGCQFYENDADAVRVAIKILKEMKL